MTVIQQLSQVPGPIRRWMGSEEVVDIIVELEEKFGLDPDDSALTFLLFDLEVKDIALPDFVGEMAYDLGITEEQARPIYDEIRTRILAPIAPELVAYGIGTASDFPTPAPAPAPIASLAPEPAPAVIQPATPSPVAPVTPQPAPVSLYRDTLASQTTIGKLRLGVRDTGDISGTVASAPIAQRAARIDLGIPVAPSPAKEAEFKSIFVERETPLPQKIDYGIPPPASPAAIPQAPVPLGSAPAPIVDSSAPFISPQIEVVSAPSAPAPDAGAPQGFLSSLMQRVAPWHAKKFSRPDVPDPLLPAATINYSDVPPAPTPDAPAPIPLSDAPPAPRA